MMRAMMARLLAALLVCLLSQVLPARAQFYDLDGAYRCLKSPDPQCEKDLADRPAPAPPPPPPTKPTEPSLDDVIVHVRNKTAGPKDIEVLARLSGGNDPRAVEMLAWCELNGIGTASNPVAAYWLYRQAAGLGVAHARENQIAIFERQLTPDQRQEVLTGENKR